MPKRNFRGGTELESGVHIQNFPRRENSRNHPTDMALNCVHRTSAPRDGDSHSTRGVAGVGGGRVVRQ